MDKMYTTGEIAAACSVTVRTVQYYDSRGLLSPSALSEGGRRLYSDKDMRKMQTICFLRDAGLSLNAISALLDDEASAETLSVFLEETENSLREKAAECGRKLAMIREIRKELDWREDASSDSLHDIASMMQSRKKLARLHAIMILTGIPVTLLQWISIAAWIAEGRWKLFALWVPVSAIYGTWVTLWYFRRTGYICPCCHKSFRPPLREAFFARHTPKLRKLTCPECGRRTFCVEIYSEEGSAR